MTTYSKPLTRENLAEYISRLQQDIEVKRAMQKLLIKAYDKMSDYKVMLDSRKRTDLDILTASKNKFIIRYNPNRIFA